MNEQNEWVNFEATHSPFLVSRSPFVIFCSIRVAIINEKLMQFETEYILHETVKQIRHDNNLLTFLFSKIKASVVFCFTGST